MFRRAVFTLCGFAHDSFTGLPVCPVMTGHFDAFKVKNNGIVGQPRFHPLSDAGVRNGIKMAVYRQVIIIKNLQRLEYFGILRNGEHMHQACPFISIEEVLPGLLSVVPEGIPVYMGFHLPLEETAVIGEGFGRQKLV